MKKLFMSFVLVMASVAVFAQCNYNEVETVSVSQPTLSSVLSGGYMERDGRNLTLDGRELSDAEVRELVGAENYETYLSAQKQITVGRVFTPIFWSSLGATVLLFAATLEDSDFYYPMMLAANVADISCPLMCIFKGIGKGRMNWVADEYNKGNHTATSYSVMPSVMRTQGNAGLGLSFCVNF